MRANRTPNRVRGLNSPIPSGYIVGRSSSGTSAAQLISIAELGQALAQTGIIDGASGTSLLPLADKRILANISGGTALPSANTLTAILDAILGATQGDIIYRNASAWVILAPGTAGKLLATGGAAANPSWTTAPTVLNGMLPLVTGDLPPTLIGDAAGQCIGVPL